MRTHKFCIVRDGKEMHLTCMYEAHVEDFSHDEYKEYRWEKEISSITDESGKKFRITDDEADLLYEELYNIKEPEDAFLWNPFNRRKHTEE